MSSHEDTKMKDEYDEKRSSSRDRDRDYDRRDSRDYRDRDREKRRDRSRDKDDRHSRRSDHWEPRRKRSRSRSRSRSRRRSASPRRSRRRSRSSSRRRTRSRSREKKEDPFARSLGGPMNADHEEAVEFAKISKRENRVYVGNLSYEVKYRDLMEFMRGAGEVLFAEVLVTPTGVSKGCGIVEFASQEDAQRSVKELSEVALLGRPVYIREDREEQSRFGATPVPGKMGLAMAGQGLSAGPPPRPAHHNHFNGGAEGGGIPNNQLYIGNLPYQAGWQDLKDLFRAAGGIVRADINLDLNGRPKGSGTVVFENLKDAEQAISMYHGYDWYGRILEVRPVRDFLIATAGLQGGRGGFRGGLRGGFRGGFRGGGFPRGGFRGGGFRGGFGGGAGGREFSQDMYADYSGPGQHGGGMNGGGSGFGGGGGFHGHAGAGAGFNGGAISNAEPSKQIIVRNLPWSTANEDLIIFEGTRSKGMGVVQFAAVNEAETAIAKFQQYMYGGRPLDVQFNDRWHTFTPNSAKGTSAAPVDS
ncbi:hypothetical protein DL96DRAFT_1595036 [Flagelloscypha sp. PMI_526]|nr:hypothetical protein DL96DRAFT_1595036 [Flagelloscypha sp. PMI_526]